MSNRREQLHALGSFKGWFYKLIGQPTLHIDGMSSRQALFPIPRNPEWTGFLILFWQKCLSFH